MFLLGGKTNISKFNSNHHLATVDTTASSLLIKNPVLGNGSNSNTNYYNISGIDDIMETLS
jgi:hypothetical protein